MNNLKTSFKSLASAIFSELKQGEHLFLNFSGDDTQFVRINASKVRQSGVVENYFLDFTFVLGEKEGSLKKATGQITLSLDEKTDLTAFRAWINNFRQELPNFPVDPYAELPQKKTEESIHEAGGTLLSREVATASLIQPWNGQDLAGFYAAGLVVSGMANSAGLFHWFMGESFNLDFSLYTSEQKALKGGFSGTVWNEQSYSQKVKDSIAKRSALEKPSIKLAPGDYRVYLAPAALSDVIDTMSGTFSELSIRQSQSPLRFLRAGEKKLSEKFTIVEDFSDGLVPRFNEEGELAEKKMVLIEKGELKSTLIHSRTAKEFGVTANGARSSEGMRSPLVLKGQLSEAKILSTLGTGIYISNLHYLNWSDGVNGRITGMTRYACFWVENGEIKCPIENLRFDETIFDLLGSAVVDFTDFDEYIPVTNTYYQRQIGGVRTPGVVLSKMSFTL